MAFAGLHRTAGLTDVASTYCAFTCALLVWGWHELSFLTGWVTGPRQCDLEAGARGWKRFVQATQNLDLARAGHPRHWCADRDLDLG